MLIYRSLNYIATVHESTSKAVLMYKGIDQIPISSINTVTPVLFMSGNGGDSASITKNKKKFKNNFETLATPTSPTMGQQPDNKVKINYVYVNI